VGLRMNPSTLGWYLPLLVHDAPGAMKPDATTSGPLLVPPNGIDDHHGDHSAVRLHPFASTRTSHQRDGDLATAPKSGGGRLTPWEDLDSKFRRDLPDDSYVGRLAYRGMVMRACPKVRVIDGVSVTEGERQKAEKLLQSALKAKAKAAERHP